MKVLFALDKYRKRVGGADRSARGIVKVLSEAGHRVRVMEVGTKREKIMNGNTTVLSVPLTNLRFIRDGEFTMMHWNRQWEPLVTGEIESFRPDLVLTQNVLAPATIAAARKAGVRSVIMFRGYRCLSPTFFLGQDALTASPVAARSLDWRRRLKWPLVRRSLQRYAEAYRNADLVIANSRYSARVIERFFNRRAEVLYPIIDLDSVSRGGSEYDKDLVLFVKPYRVKGVHVMMQIARALPRIRFAAVGVTSPRTRWAMARIGNLEYHGWLDDMPALYRRAAVLLGPSQIPEPFGRIFVEAALYGVPSVASRAGGIPEAVGEGGILVDPWSSTRMWVDALEQALEPGCRERLGRAAHRSAQDILVQHDGKRLLRILKMV